MPQDFSRIAELNTQYRDLPGDFAFSLIVISECLDVGAMPRLGYAYATLDSDLFIGVIVKNLLGGYFRDAIFNA
ncbi:hypothetical protein [Nostoc sp. CALU 546]|uniref:hypothetical protein n=1 Tax=Nostoc sp. CALU 546 TaxID=1867241 RepID=UPI003B684CCE